MTPSTHIYFIEAVGLGAVKIGIAVDPKKRLRNLQTGCPYPLRLIASYRGDEDDEARLHEWYADKRVRGEWFVLDAEMRDDIDAPSRAVVGDWTPPELDDSDIPDFPDEAIP